MSEETKFIRALFYVTPKFKWKYIVNWLITIWTWCKFSHCELWTPEEDKMICCPPAFTATFMESGTLPYRLHLYGTCWTSTMRGGDNGTRSKDASLVLKHPKNWVYFEIAVTAEQYASLVTWMEYQVAHNKGYGKWDLLKFVMPIHFPDDSRNICSEFLNNGLCAICILNKWGIINPKKAYKKLIKAGYESKPL